ncbi:MAG: bifunctional aspartate kinase/homoserine dehydrogenase I [Bacteroidales bacterium]|nr:bifunctional aspartate kinase/homoserine dehydrogenase I [Bacteroidales bacterium]MDY6000858.1 bifunctional aspartate kinase/homoserine dehydrogenase I [Candidatus Cryptobacteroides sp.]
MQVLKFGGTSVATADNISKVISIVNKAVKKDRTILVCSAISKCTDALIAIGGTAAKRDEKYKNMIDVLQARHHEIISELLPPEYVSSVTKTVDQLFDSLRGIAYGVYLLGELSPTSLDAIQSYGELFSTKIIAAGFSAKGIDNHWVDSRKIVRTNADRSVDIQQTSKNIFAVVDSSPSVNLFILPGFIASDEQGRTSTLGRGGSDYTASLLAVGVNARLLEIWTDVSGMMTANPKIVPQARTIRNISYRAALELSHFGAKVIFPPTIQPVVAEGIPIYVKNTFSPQDAGTLIEKNPPRGDGNVIGISNSDNIALISLEGSGMVGVPGFSSRLFDALTRAGINIILITQASSVHTMCIAISEKDAPKAKKAADDCFAYEISLGKLRPLKVEKGFSIVCLVGDDVIGHSGATGRMLVALGRNGIPVRATAQGSSERNISVIVPSGRVDDAIRHIHNEFFEAHIIRTVNLFIAGYGTVGKAFMNILTQKSNFIALNTGKRIKVCGLSNSRKYIIDAEGIDTSKAGELLERGESAEAGAFFEALSGLSIADSIFVDCTASPTTFVKYSSLFHHGYSVVACNKIPFSGPYSQYSDLKLDAFRAGVRLKYETTAGAALPIICTIAQLVEAGDKISKIEAVVSGTLNYLLSNYDGGDLDALVKDAHDKGYTEPDPSVDLSGTDVLRKLLIMARECGCQLEAEDVELEPFPDGETLKKEYAKAAKAGKCLRYVATLIPGPRVSGPDSEDNVEVVTCESAKIGIQAVDADSPMYNLEGTDNEVIITSENYPNSIVIRGAGAGAPQTAGGLLGDILSI